jgi:hypothetical protein
MISIETKYIGASDRRLARIAATTGTGFRLVQTIDYSLGDVQRHLKVAQALIRKHINYAPDSETMVYGGTKNGFVFCFPTSTITLKETP